MLTPGCSEFYVHEMLHNEWSRATFIVTFLVQPPLPDLDIQSRK